MALFTVLYLTAVGIYIAVGFLRGRITLNWAFILLATAIHAFIFFGWLGILLLVAAWLISTVTELVSLKTRFNVFGVRYRYDLSHEFFPSRIALLNVYPVEVSAAWVLLKYLSFFITAVIASAFYLGPIVHAVLSAAMLVSFDVMLDPYAVSLGAWHWQKPGRFFGIPWRNFVGWFAVGLVVSSLFSRLELHALDERALIVVAVIACAVTPLTTVWRLFSRDPLKAILAILPLGACMLAALYTTFG